MADMCVISQRMREEQKRIFRIATDPMRYGLTLKAIAIDSGIPFSTLRTYADGSAIMPITAVFKLCKALPTELLSLILPEGLAITANGERIDHDDMAAKALDYSMEYARARHPDSPAGVQIAACEEAVLTGKAAKLRAIGE